MANSLCTRPPTHQHPCPDSNCQSAQSYSIRKLLLNDSHSWGLWDTGGSQCSISVSKSAEFTLNNNRVYVCVCVCVCVCDLWASQVVLVVKKLPSNEGDARDMGSIPGSGRSSRGRHRNPLKYSCLENLTDRGIWQATDPRVAKSWT